MLRLLTITTVISFWISPAWSGNDLLSLPAVQSPRATGSILLDVARGKSRRIARSDNYNFSWLSWSPDSRWLAFVVAAENSNDQVHLYNVEKKSDTAVTTDRYDSYSPTWSSDGRFLYFLSDRNFESLVASPWGPRQPEPFFDRTTQIFELSLHKKQRSVFQSTDELVDGGGKKKPAAGCCAAGC